jgi:hypothetical protein
MLYVILQQTNIPLTFTAQDSPNEHIISEKSYNGHSYFLKLSSLLRPTSFGVSSETGKKRARNG